MTVASHRHKKNIQYTIAVIDDVKNNVIYNK